MSSWVEPKEVRLNYSVPARGERSFEHRTREVKPAVLYLNTSSITKNFNAEGGHSTYVACVMVDNLWVFVHATSFLNAEHQTSKQHAPFFLSLWFNSAEVGFERLTSQTHSRRSNHYGTESGRPVEDCG